MSWTNFQQWLLGTCPLFPGENRKGGKIRRDIRHIEKQSMGAQVRYLILSIHSSYPRISVAFSLPLPSCPHRCITFPPYFGSDSLTNIVCSSVHSGILALRMILRQTIPWQPCSWVYIRVRRAHQAPILPGGDQLSSFCLLRRYRSYKFRCCARLSGATLVLTQRSRVC